MDVLIGAIVLMGLMFAFGGRPIHYDRHPDKNLMRRSGTKTWRTPMDLARHEGWD